MEKERLAKGGYENLLKDELLKVEKRSHQLSGWILAVTIIALNAFSLSLDNVEMTPFRIFSLVLSGALVLWFAGTAFLINRGFYHALFKYLNLVLQVSTVTFFMLASARLLDVDTALSSTAPLMYLMVIGLTSMSLNPLLSLLAGGFAAGQFVGAYAIWMQQDAFHSVFQSEQQAWIQVVLKAIIFMMMGVAAMIIARRSRSMLEKVVAEVSYEEQIRFIENDMIQAAEIQENLIPSTHIECGQFDIETFYSPAKQVGGDYFDIIKNNDGSCFVLMADVSGKGYSAALMMSNIQAIVRTLVAQGSPIDDLILAVNQSVFNASVRGLFVSLVCMVIDPVKGQVRYINAGHNPAIMINAKGELTELESTAPVLGVMKEYPVKCETLPFCDNTMLFAYTDGLSELKSPDGIQLGLGKIEHMMREVYPASSSQMKECILALIYDHLKDAEPRDDLSFICIRQNTNEH